MRARAHREPARHRERDPDQCQHHHPVLPGQAHPAPQRLGQPVGQPARDPVARPGPPAPRVAPRIGHRTRIRCGDPEPRRAHQRRFFTRPEVRGRLEVVGLRRLRSDPGQLDPEQLEASPRHLGHLFSLAPAHAPNLGSGRAGRDAPRGACGQAPTCPGLWTPTGPWLRSEHAHHHRRRTRPDRPAPRTPAGRGGPRSGRHRPQPRPRRRPRGQRRRGGRARPRERQRRRPGPRARRLRRGRVRRWWRSGQRCGSQGDRRQGCCGAARRRRRAGRGRSVT